MYSNLLALTLTALVAVGHALPGLLDDRAVCNADNCLRAVRATAANPPASEAAADCSSFFRTTITGAAPTTTVTVTAAPTNGVNAARDAAASPTLPPYVAKACSNTVRYSSACSCAGITSYGTVTAAPSTTVTVTVTQTPTTIGNACSSFIVRATSGPDSVNNKYARYSGVLDLSEDDASRATTWTLQSNGQILSPNIAQIWANYPGPASYVDFAGSASLPPCQAGEGQPEDESQHALYCSIANTAGRPSGAISCLAWEGTGYVNAVFQVCPSYADDSVLVDAILDTESVGDDCAPVGLVAIPACS